MFDFIKNLLGGNAQSQADANLQRELDRATQIDYQRGATLGNSNPSTYNPNVVNDISNTYGNLQSFQDAGNYNGDGGGGGGISPEAQDYERRFNEYMNSIKGLQQVLVDSSQKYYDRLSEFEKNSPFAFDEVQARAGSESVINPYYKATLDEFVTGWRRSSSRSAEDMTRTVGELNADASKLSERERFSTQEAIRSSEEGNAGAGLFFSGKRMRETGIQEVGGLQKQEDITTNLQRGIGSAQRTNSRNIEDIALEEARRTRLLEAERTTALETDIANKKKEAQIQHELERQAFAGQGPGTNFGNQLSYQNQMYQMY